MIIFKRSSQLVKNSSCQISSFGVLLKHECSFFVKPFARLPFYFMSQDIAVFLKWHQVYIFCTYYIIKNILECLILIFFDPLRKNKIFMNNINSQYTRSLI